MGVIYPSKGVSRVRVALATIEWGVRYPRVAAYNPEAGNLRQLAFLNWSSDHGLLVTFHISH